MKGIYFVLDCYRPIPLWSFFRFYPGLNHEPCFVQGDTNKYDTSRTLYQERV